MRSDLCPRGSLGDAGWPVKVAYARCVDGHYFVGSACPLDGWSSDAVRQIDHISNLLRAEGHEISIDLLREHGCGEEAIRRAVVVEYGAPDAAFDAIEPAALIIDGKHVMLRDLPEHFR